MTRVLLVAALTVLTTASARATSYVAPNDPGAWLAWGNGMTRHGEIPAAIFAYRMGLRDLPDEPHLRRGLDYARSRVTLSPDERETLTPRPNPWAPARHFVRLRGPFVAAAASVLGWIAAGCWVVTRRLRWFFAAVGLLGLMMLLAGAWFVDRTVQQRENETPFGVVTQSAVLRRGDGYQFLPRREAPLPPGVEVRVIGTRGDWIQVELADGTVGWIPSASAVLSRPRLAAQAAVAA